MVQSVVIAIHRWNIAIMSLLDELSSRDGPQRLTEHLPKTIGNEKSLYLILFNVKMLKKYNL